MENYFDNTAVAFAGKSDRDLRRAQWLFSVLSRPWLVQWGAFFSTWGLKLGLPLKPLIRQTIYRQFVGGETIQKSQKSIEELWKFRVGTILDYSIEGKTAEEDFDACLKELLRTATRAKGDPAIPFVVFKVTGMAPHDLLEKVSRNQSLSPAETAAWQKVRQRIFQLCETCAQQNTPVFIDAEESWIQPAIDGLAEDMMWTFNREHALVYNTVQMYRIDRLAYLKDLHQRALKQGCKVGVKIVRGAYMEKERERAGKQGYADPIQPHKEATDRDFNLAVEFCWNAPEVFSFCAGTHNEESSALLAALLAKAENPNHTKQVWFAQLLGMSDHISFNLAARGYQVAKYVPYGPVEDVLPYLTRRARENTSVAGQTGRELSLLKKELNRRQAVKK